MPPDPSMTQIVQWLTSLGGTGAMAAFIYLLYTGKIVWRRELDAAEGREKEWKDLALRSLGNSERAVTTAEHAATAAAQIASK